MCLDFRFVRLRRPSGGYAALRSLKCGEWIGGGGGGLGFCSEKGGLRLLKIERKWMGMGLEEWELMGGSYHTGSS